MKARLVALFAALVAIPLLYLAVPRALAAFLMLPAQPVLLQLQSLQPVDPEALDKVIDAQSKGLAWSAPGRTWTDLGLAQLLQADGIDITNPEWRQAMQEAILSFREGLSRAPANPYAWTRLAYAEAQLNGWSPEALSALRLAFITAPYEPRLMLSRLRLAFSAWPHLNDDDQQMVYQQVRFAWASDPQALVTMAIETNRANLVRAALLTSPEHLQAFESRLSNSL